MKARTKLDVRITPEMEMAMMLEPQRWPMWPLLPVKHRRSDGPRPRVGVVAFVEGYDAAQGVVMFAPNVNMYDDNIDAAPFQPRRAADLVAEGWIVD